MDLVKAQTIAREVVDQGVRHYLLKLQGRSEKNVPVEIQMIVNGIETHIARVDEFDPEVRIPSQICAGCGG